MSVEESLEAEAETMRQGRAQQDDYYEYSEWGYTRDSRDTQDVTTEQELTQGCCPCQFPRPRSSTAPARGSNLRAELRDT